MAGKSTISWTERTWNPVVGCSVVSPGCTNCYAMRMAYRVKEMEEARTGRPDASHYFGTTKVVNGNPVWTGKVVLAPEHILLEPLRRRKPTMYFVNSMSDLFHEDVPDEWIDRVFAVMALCPQHTFQVLTKRSKRMRAYCTDPDRIRECNVMFAANEIDGSIPVNLGGCQTGWPLPNVWLGVSCEDQRRADERIPDLLATPAAVRFVSAEPLLGPMDIRKWLPGSFECSAECGYRAGESAPPREEKCQTCFHVGEINSEFCPECGAQDFSYVCPDCGADVVQHHPDTPHLDWIIVGGESGPGHRAMQMDWAVDVMRQCREAGTPLFFKQDSHSKPGQRGRASDELWACKEMPL